MDARFRPCTPRTSQALAMSYELSGGLIKNAVLSGLSIAVARDGPDPVLTMEDLRAGARSQLRGTFQKDNGDRCVQPKCGLDGASRVRRAGREPPPLPQD